MRKLIVSNFMTLDGYYESSDKTFHRFFEHWLDEYGANEAFDEYNVELLREAEALVLSGRSSFLGNKDFWASYAGSASTTAVRLEFADLIAGTPKLVVSDAIAPQELAPWESTTEIVRGDDLLERISLDSEGRRRLATELARSEHIAESVVVSTCNRTEVYVEAVTFHGAVAAVTEALESVADLPRADLTDRLAVHFEDRAIAHAFRVAGGLDSMALGESQIRAQLRMALHEAQEERVVGPALNTLFQRALRVGKTDARLTYGAGFAKGRWRADYAHIQDWNDSSVRQLLGGSDTDSLQAVYEW